ncbi:hypothetical protein [Fictibacillus phosphorivorans]|uniref:hypothetical protein n=1 Tax=Fictibacillus phosphorivorans TaxID=1221500 RepID=UPI00203D9083|nr:hypothetical protein [Fictibacillus phosphorivorans]MCM3717559.1 hypothetical protein [Fictibacillus phosphorivorans]MCM3775254.1 hypothetical protein [Fictibacillus phosphorivorans]
MTDKKIWILLPPFVLIGLFLLFYLPKDLKAIALLTGLFFWVTHQIWINLENKKNRK